MKGLRAWLLFFLVLCPRLEASMLEVEADHVQRLGDRIEAAGKVVITGQALELHAGYVVYDTLTGDIWATGKCTLVEKQSEVEAETIYFNARRGDMHVRQGSLLILEQPLKITGEAITRYGQDFYVGRDVVFTPCLAPRPAWEIAANSLEIPLEGYARVKGARFNVCGVPTLALPYLLYPAKLSRQSGILFPVLGNSTDTGNYLGLPIYLVTGASSDLTITPTLLARRGLLMSAEFRYRLDYDEGGEFYLEGLHDERGGKPITGTILDTIPEDRWFFKASHQGPDLMWDVNLVSNEDYFRDIGTFYRFGEDDQELLGDKRPQDLEELISRMEWLKRSNGFSASVSAQWKQDLTVAGDERTIQELPRLKLRMAQKEVPFTPLKCSAEAGSVRVYTREWIEAIKNQAGLELSWPLSVAPYFTLRPYLREQYRDTLFTTNAGSFNTTSWAWRQRPYAKNTYAERWQVRGVSLATNVYSPRFGDNWYHQITPQAGWSATSRHGDNYDANDPAHQRDIYPDLLSGDSWTRDFDMDLALTNTVRDASGRAIFELGLGRVYHYLPKTWDRVEAELAFSPAPWIALKHTNRFGRNELRPYATHEHSSTLSLEDTRGDTLSLSGEYDRLDTKSLVGSGTLKIGDRLDVRAEAKYDYVTEFEDMRRCFRYFSTGITYTSQCWSIELVRFVEPRHDVSLEVDGVTTRETLPRETTIELRINLLGLGDVISTSRTLESD